jgi:hypothetical protein
MTTLTPQAIRAALQIPDLTDCGFSLIPRTDQPQRYDQQAAFLKSNHPGVTFLLGGNGAGTTTAALCKVVEFLNKTEPPRRDTPFWIIAESYEQAMNVCWKEKLHGRQLLYSERVDWNRIHWHKPSNDWPYSVPLKSSKRAPGRNWQLVFKSCEQGRARMQGESIGGFLFVEQFPWGLLEEVLRGCRDYDFCGNKLAEFTPVDPSMSFELQLMEQEGRLPPGWAIYRANTECALEAGHITQQWFDQFFGMIPKSMRDVRTKGLWGGFEGAIYPEFDPAIHCLPPSWKIPPNCQHRRMIDWGFGAANSFCCLFACRNGIGQWFIYDEYYSNSNANSAVEHLKAVSDMHRWPQNSPYYGATWSDPSDVNCFRIAAALPHYAPGYQAIFCQPAKHSVEAGIQHIKWLLDPALAMPNGPPQPRLFIVREKCPNLIRQLRSYRRIRNDNSGLNPKDAPDAPLKADDHAVDALRYGLYSEASTTTTVAAPTLIPRQWQPNRFGIQGNFRGKHGPPRYF